MTELQLNQFPVEITEIIFSFIEDSHYILLFVCRDWYNIINNYLQRQNKKIIKNLNVLLGTVSLTKWSIEEVKLEKNSHLSDVAAMNCNLDVIQYINKIKCPWSIYNCYYAAELGNLDILKWAREKKHYCDSNVYYNAAKGGHIHVLKWLSHMSQTNQKKSFEGAAVSGNINILKWLYNQNYKWDFKTFDECAKYGHLESLKWLCENKCPSTNMSIINASQNGYLEVVKWLYNKDYQLESPIKLSPREDLTTLSTTPQATDNEKLSGIFRTTAVPSASIGPFNDARRRRPFNLSILSVCPLDILR